MKSISSSRITAFTILESLLILALLFVFVMVLTGLYLHDPEESIPAEADSDVSVSPPEYRLQSSNEKDSPRRAESN